MDYSMKIIERKLKNTKNKTGNNRQYFSTIMLKKLCKILSYTRINKNYCLKIKQIYNEGIHDLNLFILTTATT